MPLTLLIIADCIERVRVCVCVSVCVFEREREREKERERVRERESKILEYGKHLRNEEKIDIFDFPVITNFVLADTGNYNVNGREKREINHFLLSILLQFYYNLQLYFSLK